MNNGQLSAIDRKILEELSADGRLSNRELAARLGIPSSTCHGRVRNLEQLGVIRRYRAEIDLTATGATVEALISVGLVDSVRAQVTHAMPRLQAIPGVQRVYLVGGDYDYLLHVACDSVPALRDLIRTHLSTAEFFGRTKTQLVFDRRDGTSPVAAL